MDGDEHAYRAKQSKHGVRQLADDEYAHHRDQSHRNVVVEPGPRRQSTTTRPQCTIQARVDVHQRHQRPARPKRGEAQRLVHEEVDFAVAESSLADKEWERGTRRELHFALEEQRHVVEDCKQKGRRGRQLGSAHTAKVSTEWQTDSNVAIYGDQQYDPDGHRLANGRCRPRVRLNVRIHSVDEPRQLVSGDVVQRFERLDEETA